MVGGITGCARVLSRETPVAVRDPQVVESVSNVDATELDALTFGARPLGLLEIPAALTNQLCGPPRLDSGGSLASSLGGDSYDGS